MSYAVHFGVMPHGGGPTPPDLLPVGTIAVVGGDRRTQLRYVHDGDSFTVWGEAADCEPDDEQYGHPLHVVLNLPYGWRQESAVDLMPHLRSWLEPHLPYPLRLCDYAVVTQREDWSEEWVIVGAFA